PSASRWRRWRSGFSRGCARWAIAIRGSTWARRWAWPGTPSRPPTPRKCCARPTPPCTPPKRPASTALPSGPATAKSPSSRPEFGYVGPMLTLFLVLAQLELPAAAKAFPFPTEVQTLDNGLRVVLVQYDSPGLVAYYTLMRVGSRNEAEK